MEKPAGKGNMDVLLGVDLPESIRGIVGEGWWEEPGCVTGEGTLGWRLS